MTVVGSRLHGLWWIVVAVCLLPILIATPTRADNDEPIAYIGHGAFFDQKGNQIAPTAEFVARAQDWYQAKLLAGLNAAKKAEFAAFEKQLNAAIRAEGQERLVVRHRLLDWLVANAPQVAADGRTVGKLNALKYQLNWKLPERATLDQNLFGEEFKLTPDIENRLKLPALNPVGLHVETATTNTGQNYINECMAAGVPVPPTIGVLDPAGVAGWKSQGFIPTAEQFIVNSPAEVRTFKSTSPSGMCIALPRYTDASKSTVALDGVICLGQTSSKVCFWDNQMQGNTFTFPAGTRIPSGSPITP